ncbi:MAG: type II toxin-antitoxin system Phd/YefM family antitoxin [Thiobacillaceae bacterium]
MKELTIREAREGMSQPEQMFADADENLVARILPAMPRRPLSALKAIFEGQALQTVPGEVLLAEEHEERG